MSINLKTHKMLWGRSGNMCAYPECKKELVMDETENEDIQNDVKKEFERVFSLIPKWTPATQRGKNIEQSFIAIFQYAANGK